MILNDFDYKNVDPETLKEWDREYRNKCRREMTQYLKDFPDATPEEKRALSSWVRSGHSPYVFPPIRIRMKTARQGNLGRRRRESKPLQMGEFPSAAGG